MSGKGRDFRTTISIGGEIDPAVKAAIESMADRLEMLEGVADEAQGQLEELEKASRDLKGGFTIAKGAAADLVSSGIQTIVGAAKDAATSIYGLAESTREFRQDMGTLETAFDSAGFSAETATDTWKGLYSVFGEDDRAVEAANNIARMADNQEELEEWVKITTGVWGTYQDALPVESLAEAAAETAKVGQVTGTFADALNWSSEAAEMLAGFMNDEVTTAEDAFNVALSACSDEADRQALITDTLTVLYGDAAAKYEETAGTLMDANAANADYTLTLAEMGEKIEPVTTAVQSGITGILDKILDLTSGGDVSGFAESIGASFQWLNDTIFPLVESVIPALSDAFSDVKARVEPMLTAMMSAASSVIPLLSSVLSGLWPIILTVMDAISPIITAVQSIITQLVPPLIALINMAMPILQTLAAIIRDYVGNALEVIMPIIQNVINVFSGLVSFLQNVFLGNWAGVWEDVVSIFSNIVQGIVGILKAPLNGVISLINSVISGINSMGFDIPDWVPVIGGQAFRLDIPEIPLLATGGFTNGPSIAGEAGTEAVISFDPAYRAQNLAYWAKAGRMLGADEDGTSFSLGGSSGGGVNLGGVTFAPQITVTGQADKESIMEAIEAEYPEFIDMLEAWFAGRGKPVYG